MFQKLPRKPAQMIWWMLLLWACSQPSPYPKAEDALDAAREYVNACQQGDFTRAVFYAVKDAKNIQVLGDTEKSYRERDKEGRQLLRTASINISEVKALGDSAAEIHYSNSLEKQPHTLRVIKRNGEWVVDAATSK